MEIFTKEIIARSRKQRKKEFCSAGDIFRMLEMAAGEHNRALGFGRSRLLENDAAWILTGQKVRFLVMPRPGQKLRIGTWPGKMRFALFSRHYLIEDEQNHPVVRAASNWTLLHLKNRSILPPKKAGISVEPVVTGTELELEKHIPAAKALPSLQRAVLPEDIDANGHVNNAVYADWIEEYLTSPDSGLSLPALRSISIQYRHELRLGDRVQIRTERSGDRILLTGESEGKTAFCAAAEG